MIYILGLVAIGEQLTILQRSHICAETQVHADPQTSLQKLPITEEA